MAQRPIFVVNTRKNVRGMESWANMQAHKAQHKAARAGAVAALRASSLMVQPRNSLMARPMGRPAPEIKSFDQLIGNGAVANFLPTYGTVASAEPTFAFAGITCINEVLQGDTFYQRIGAKTVTKSIQYRANFFFTPAVGVGNPSVTVRWMIVYDRQPNGAYPVIANILADNQNAPAFNSGVNMVNRSRFLILRDQIIDMDIGQGYNKTISGFVKGRWDNEYGSTSASIGEILTGAFYFIAFCDEGTDVGTVTVFDAHTRIRYFD